MIIKDKNICGGSPVIKGTRIMASIILANIRDGVSFEEICLEYSITKNDIVDCIDYSIQKINL